MNQRKHQNHREQFQNQNICLSAAALSVIGDREEQQDRMACLLKQEEGLFVVCDGMGGYQNGGLAAQTALKAVTASYAAMEPGFDPDVYLMTRTRMANEAVCRLNTGAEEEDRAGTTLVSVIIRNRLLYWSSVGDSRAYLYRKGTLAQITEDHNYRTVLDSQLRQGLISELYYDRQSRHQGVLISYLGIGPELLVDHNRKAFALEPEDRVILMSDGLYRLMEDCRICEVLKHTKEPASALGELEDQAQQQALRLQISRDNLTAVLIRVL